MTDPILIFDADQWKRIKERLPNEDGLVYSTVNVGSNERGELVRLDPTKKAEAAWRPSCPGSEEP